MNTTTTTAPVAIKVFLAKDFFSDNKIADIMEALHGLFYNYSVYAIKKQFTFEQADSIFATYSDLRFFLQGHETYMGDLDTALADLKQMFEAYMTLAEEQRFVPEYVSETYAAYQNLKEAVETILAQ